MPLILIHIFLCGRDLTHASCKGKVTIKDKMLQHSYVARACSAMTARWRCACGPQNLQLTFIEVRVILFGTGQLSSLELTALGIKLT